MVALFYGSFLASFPYVSLCWPTWLRFGRGWVATVGLFTALGYFQVAQHVFATFRTGEDVFPLPLNAGSTLLFPMTLATLLYLYVAKSAAAFRWVCVFVVAVNGGVAAATCLVRAGVLPSGPDSWAALWTPEATWKITLGTGMLLIDAVVLVGLFRWLGRRASSGVGRLTLPLLAGLVVDSAGYAGVVAYFDGGSYWERLGSQAASKSGVGFLYAVALWLMYLRRREPDAVRTPMPARWFLGRAFPPAAWLFRRAVRLAVPAGRPAQPGLTVVAIDGIAGRMGVPTQTAARPLTPDDLRAAQKRFEREFAGLLTTHLDLWVAYGPAGLILSRPTVHELDDAADAAGYRPGSYLVRQVVPWLALSLEISPDTLTDSARRA